MAIYQNKNNPTLSLDPTAKDLATQQGGASDITFEQRLANSGYAPMQSPTTTSGATTQKTVNAADLMAGRVDANGNPTVGQAYAGLIPSSDPNLEAAYAAQGKMFQDATAPVDENTIRANTQARFQAEVDALNRVYAEKKAQAAVQGEGRLGQGTAINARRGLIGSDFGNAQNAKIADQNMQVQNDIQDELSMKIAGINSKIASSVAEEFAAKQAARQQGAQQYIDFLKGAAQRKDERTTTAVGSLVGNGITPDESVFANMASQLGTTVDDVKLKYNAAKAKTVTQNKLIEVSPGASLFDQNGRLIGTAPNKPNNGEPLTKEVNGALLQYDTNSGTWKQVYNSPVKNNLPASAQEYEYAVGQGYKGSFTDYQNEDANRKAQVAKITAGGLNSAQLNAAFKLADDYERASGDYSKQVSAYNRMVASAQDPSPAGDLSLIFNYMKVLDPGSTVREGEFATAANSGTIGDKIANIYNKVVSGERLTDQQRTDFLNQSKKLYTSASKQQKQINETFSQRAQQFDIPADFVIRNQNSFNDQPIQQNTTLSEIELNELRKEFPGMSDQQLQQQAGFNMPLSTGENGSLGGLSQKYESSGDPGAIGYDSTGGFSYGTYQLAHNNAQRFVAQSPYAQEFAGIPFNSAAFRNKWKEIAQKDPQGFAQAQEQYITKTHFEPLAAKAAQAGLDISQHSPVLSEVIFSTGVQHGAGTDVINRALAKVGPNASDADIIKAIYEERWGGGQRFASSTPQVRQAVYNRFFGKNGELATALNQLQYS